jgi:hypothetical protein
MEEWEQYRGVVNIDGVGNSWGLFTMLALDSAVILFDSPYTSWWGCMSCCSSC